MLKSIKRRISRLRILKKKFILYSVSSFFILLLILLAQSRAGSDNSLFTSGTKTKTFTHQGISRQYDVYLPQGYKKSKAYPLVVALHGSPSGSKEMAEISQLNKTADREGFLVLYPQGTGSTLAGQTYGSWNAGSCCGSAKEKKVDDVDFISQAIAKTYSDYSVDRRRIYVTGFSNGAQMAYALACSPVSAKIAAIAPVSGLAPLESIPNCKPLRKIPIIHIHGDQDTCIPVKGGTCGACVNQAVQKVAVSPTQNPTWACPSLPSYFSDWLKINGLPKKPLKVTDQGPLTCQYYGWSKDNYSMELCTIEGAGHTWSGGSYGSACRFLLSGSCLVAKKTLGHLESQVSTNNLMWEFFKAHPKPSLAAITGGYIMGGLWNLFSD